MTNLINPSPYGDNQPLLRPVYRMSGGKRKSKRSAKRTRRSLKKTRKTARRNRSSKR